MDGLSITVRRGVVGDLASLASMIRENNGEFSETDYCDEVVMRDHLGPDRQVLAVVAEAEGELCGYATLIAYYNSDDAERAYWLDELYVTPGMRSRGIGAELMRGVRRIAAEDGRPSVWWGVERENVRAVAFYDRIGAVDYKATIYRLDA